METNQEIQKLGKVHILGIGGAGMSGIARLLVAQGVTVSGSDAKDSRRVEALKKLGVKIFIGHDAKNLENIDQKKYLFLAVLMELKNIPIGHLSIVKVLLCMYEDLYYIIII